jgi:anti-sigma factor RsiW
MADLSTEINCRGLVEVVTDYIEGALTPAQAAVVERHLETCEGCRRYLAQMRVTIATLGRLREDDVPDEMRQRLRAAFRELTKR